MDDVASLLDSGYVDVLIPKLVLVALVDAIVGGRLGVTQGMNTGSPGGKSWVSICLSWIEIPCCSQMMWKSVWCAARKG